MDRHPPPRRGREFPRGEGPFDRLRGSRFERDPAPLIIGGIIIFLAILILILILLVPLGGGGGEGPGQPREVGCGIIARRADKLPDLPEGLVALSPLYEMEVPPDAEERGCRLTTISLDTPTQDPSNLGFYTYQDGTWQLLKSASLSEDGAAAEAELAEIPANLAVLRLAAATFLALGSLPSGSNLDPAAAGLLRIVSPSDYSPTADGSISGSATSLPTDQGFDVYPTIAALDGEPAQAVNAILADSRLTAGHIQEIVSLAEDGAFRGMDIDYRRVEPSLRSEFSQFVSDLAAELHKGGSKLSITLPLPRVRDDSVDTGAYDWEKLGKAADFVKILPESDQSVYRQTMFQVLRYASGLIEPGKVFLVVSPFSHEKSGEGVQALTFLQAMAIANVMTVREPPALTELAAGDEVKITADNIYRQTGGSVIRWDDQTATVTFSYRRDEETRTVWLENLFSIGFKLELAQAFRLGGIAIEDVSEGSGGANVWPALEALVKGGLARLERPNPDNLRPQWTASGGNLDVEGAGGFATWTAPDEGGTYEISLIVSDGVARVGRRLTLEVQGPTPTPTPTPEETPTPEVVETPTPEVTETPTPEVTETPTPEVPETPTPEVTETPLPTPTPELAETPLATPEGETPTPVVTP